MHKSISDILSRRKMIKGSAAVVAATVAVPAFAHATEDEAQIIRKAVDEIKGKGGFGDEYYKKVKFIRHYPVRTVEGLAEKLRWVWGYDHCKCIDVIEADIYRLAGQKVPDYNFSNDMYSK